MSVGENEYEANGDIPIITRTDDDDHPTTEIIPSGPRPIENAPENPQIQRRKFKPPDGGWGWVVAIVSCWTNGAVFGIINTFGLIYDEMLNTLVDPASVATVSFKTAWVGSVTIGAVFLFSPISSILMDRFGLRQTAFCGACLAFIGMLSSSFIKQVELLYLTYGLIMGIGSSLVYTPSLSILGHYFKYRFGLVNGLVTVGSSIFSIGLIYAIKHMLEAVGLSHTLQILSGMHFLLIFGTLTWIPLIDNRRKDLDYILSTESIAVAVTGCWKYVSEYLNVKIWYNKSYVVYVVTVATSCFGYFVSFVHLMKYAGEKGMGAHAEVLILCITGVSGVARLLLGKIADKRWISQIHMQQLGIFLLGVTTMCIPWATQFWHLIVITCIMGVCDGCFVCLLGPIALEIVGPKSVSQAIGFLLGVFSIPMMIGPPIAGLLYDKLGSYKIPFHLAGIPPIVGSLLMFFIPKVKKRQTRVEEIDEDEMPPAALYGSFIWSSNMHVAMEKDSVKPHGNRLMVPMLSSNGQTKDHRSAPDIHYDEEEAYQEDYEEPDYDGEQMDEEMEPIDINNVSHSSPALAV